jgi:hypothetical protein
MGYHAYYSGEVSVTPPLSEDDAAVVRAFVNLEQTELTQSLFAASAASEEPDLPWYGRLLDARRAGLRSSRRKATVPTTRAVSTSRTIRSRLLTT